MTTQDKVTCNGCGRTVRFPAGYLNESQKQTFQCEACQEPVVENQVTHRNMTEGGKRVLTEDLPQ